MAGCTWAPLKNNFPATNVAQTLSLPGPEGTPDSSGRALEHAGRRPDESGRGRHECLRYGAK
jgi:hypothetical protein